MRVYRVTSDIQYQTLTFRNSNDYDRFPVSAAPAYQDTQALPSILFCRIVPFRKEGDFRGLDRFLTCNELTLGRLADTISTDTRTFQIKVDDQDFPSYLLYPVNQINAVNMSVLKPRMEAKGVKWIRDYEFMLDVFERPQMFIDPYFPTEIFYATDLGNPERDFYVRCTQLGLTGVRFEQVWQG